MSVIKLKLLSIAGVMVILSGGCTNYKTSFVTIDLGVPVRSVSLATKGDSPNSIMVNTSVISAGVQARVNAPTSINQICIAVVEGDYTKENLLVSRLLTVDSHDTTTPTSGLYSSTITLEVPAGDKRNFLVYGVGDDGSGNQVILMVGSTGIDGLSLKAGEEMPISIQMAAPRMAYFSFTGNVLSNTITTYDVDFNNWLENHYIVRGFDGAGSPLGIVYDGRVNMTGTTMNNVNVTNGDIQGVSDIFNLKTVVQINAAT